MNYYPISRYIGVLDGGVSMDDKELEIEREKTKQAKYETAVWIVFWIMLIGGCTATDIAYILTY